MNLQIFVVFHKAFDPTVLEAFTIEEQSRWFTAYAVNPAHPKTLLVAQEPFSIEAFRQRRSTLSFGPELLVEYEQPRHSPELQERGLMETSCYIHLYENDLIHGDTDYVGVCQYDMHWTDEAAQLLRAIASLPKPVKIGCGIDLGAIINSQGFFHEKAYADRRDWPFLIESYNRFFNRSLELKQLVGMPLTLFQTYLLPRAEFLELAGWLKELASEIYPWACQAPYESHWGALGGYTERAESIFFAAKIIENGMQYARLPLEHSRATAEKLGGLKTHYREKSAQ